MTTENTLLGELGITPALLKSRGLRLCVEAHALLLAELGENGNIEGYQYEPWHWCYVASQASA